MRRLLAVLLAVSLVLAMAGCGGTEESAHSAAPAPASAPEIPAETEGGYVIPTAWTEDSINDGTWGYVTQGAELPCGDGFSIENGYLVSQSRDMDTGETTLIRCALDGTEQNRIVIPVQETGDGVDCSVGYYAFGADGVWLTYDRYTRLDAETRETESYTQLQKWSYDGECVYNVPLDEGFGLGPQEFFVFGLDLDPEGNPLLLTSQGQLCFCDSQGLLSATLELPDIGFQFCHDSSGRLYLRYSFEGELYSIDWAAHSLGQVVLTTDNTEKVMPGGGGYDFLLSSDTTLRGVTLATGTITEILSWEDWDLAGSVGGAAWLDAETFLIAVSSLLLDGDQIVTLSRVPADQIPEKDVVRLAVGINEWRASIGMTWTDALDQMVTEAMNQFNRASADYRVEVETYSSAEELNLMILSGDAPDIIDWSSTGWLESPASMAIYAKRGYLRDLTPLLAEDPDYSESDFIPNILVLSKERTGGFYTLPLSFYFHTFSMSREYVGDNDSWNFSDLLAAAQRAPEGMTLLEYGTQQDMLDMLLSGGMNRFVDLLDGTCDFRNQEFYDLLTVCRDYCPAETGENYTPPAEGTLLTGEGSLGRLGQFASDVMRPLEEQGRVLIGYPNAGGSGVSIIFNEDMAICALGQQQEGAWEFLRTLLDYDFQYKYSSITCSVRQDAFHDKEDAYLKYNGSCTPEESQAARELVYEAANCRTNDSPIVPIVLEEAAAFFNGDKTAEAVADIIQNRVEIYLGEQS